MATATINKAIDDHIDQLFIDVAKEYDLPYGDISPETVNKLDGVKELLGYILGDYVHDNLPDNDSIGGF